MKKILSLTLAIMLVMSLTVPALAAGDTTSGTGNESNTAHTGETVLSTTKGVSYIITIPADVSITFDAETTAMEAITMNDDARLHPLGTVTVNASYSKALKNASAAQTANAGETIPYTITLDEETNTPELTSVVFTNEDRTSGAMTVNIKKDDWTAADSGDYSDTMTFTITYDDGINP